MTTSTWRRLAFNAAFVTLVLGLAATPAQAAFAGRNGRIAFSSLRGGRLDIYTMRPNGGHERNLTNDAPPDFQPAWSPDGRLIAFVSLDVTVSHFDQIYTMSPTGADRALLTAFEGGNPQEPAWSPDGSQIAFHVVFGGAIDSEVYTMNADGSDLVQLTDNTSEDSNPAWSPDGTQLAFVRDAQIFTMDPDGTGVRHVTPSPMLAFDPAWSPAGDSFASSATTKDRRRTAFSTPPPARTPPRPPDPGPGGEPDVVTGRTLHRVRPAARPSRERQGRRPDLQGPAGRDPSDTAECERQDGRRHPRLAHRPYRRRPPAR